MDQVSLAALQLTTRGISATPLQVVPGKYTRKVSRSAASRPRASRGNGLEREMETELPKIHLPSESWYSDSFPAPNTSKTEPEFSKVKSKIGSGCSQTGFRSRVMR